MGLRTCGMRRSPAATSPGRRWGVANNITVWEGQPKGRDGPVTKLDQKNSDARLGPSRRRGNMSTGSATADAGVGAVPTRTTGYAWLVLFMLGFIYIFNFLDRQLMSVLIESIKKDPAFLQPGPDGKMVGLSDAQMGWMTGFWFALVYTVLGVIVGFLADRTSRRNILYVGATLWSGFTALCGFAQSYPVMLAARMGV